MDAKLSDPTSSRSIAQNQNASLPEREDILRNDTIPLSGRPDGIEFYEQEYSNAPNTTLRIGRDISHAGLLLAASFIKALQTKQQLHPERDINIVFATGKTQWIALTQLERILHEWEELDTETTELLNSVGVDTNKKPDMEKVWATHLDTILPQRRESYYGYANELSHMFDRLGIAPTKRRFIYGDIKDVDDILNSESNQLSDEELRVIEESIKSEGIQIRKYLEGTLPHSHSQYSFLRGQQRYAQAIAEELSERGGPDIALFSAGGSYEGRGHIAFNESGTTKEQGIRLTELSYHAKAGNCKDNGGMHTLTNAAEEEQFGAITYGPKELFQNNDTILLTIITGKEKSESAKSMLERSTDPDYPTTLLQDGAQESALILEPGSAGSLKYSLTPWDFRKISSSDWDKKLYAKLLLQTALDVEKAIDELIPSDLINAQTERARKQREENLAHASFLDTFAKIREEVGHNIRDSLTIPERFCSRIGLSPQSKILHIGPHLDDLSLAAQFLIDEWNREHSLASYYTSPGFTAVSDRYALGALRKLAALSSAEWERLTQESQKEESFTTAEKNYLQELIQETKSDEYRALIESRKPHRYDGWQAQSERARELRAKLLGLNLLRNPKLHEELTGREQLEALWKNLSLYSEAKPQWGSNEIELMQDIKVILRFAEEQTELISRGTPYSQIHYPISSSWYALERKGTARESDIKTMKEIILREQPDMIVFNGEGFIDHGAHSITEMTVKIALMELINEGRISSDIQLFLYRGVWDRCEIDGTTQQIIIGLNEDHIRENEDSFLRNYPSQSPGLVPDGGLNEPAFFSTQVRNNSKRTLEEYRKLVGKDSNTFAGMLAFDWIASLEDDTVRSEFLVEVEQKSNELDRVQGPIARSSLAAIIGTPPPMSDLSGERGREIQRLLLDANIDINQIFSPEEQKKLKVKK